jgi:PhzF family phenazine biosynthesis protein
MEVRVRIINSFSINNSGGNPAAVVLEADNLSNDQKQTIARKIGLSETAFVSSSDVADFKLDFFTPNKQIAHCGHATIATFSYLKSIGIISKDHSSKETIDGVRKILFENGEAYMEQSSPKYFKVSNAKAIIDSLGIDEKEAHPDFPATVVNTGNSFLLVGVKDERALKKLKPDMAAISKFSEEYNCVGFYIFAVNDDAVQTRMFAPYYGIDEESATGMAAGPLACLLSTVFKTKNVFHVRQGKYMTPPSESLLNVRLNRKDGSIENLMAGGNAYLDREFDLEL